MSKKLSVDIDVPQDEMQTVFDVTEFIETNKREIANDLAPFIHRLLEEESIFIGPYSFVLDDRLEEVVRDELKNVIIDHFDVTIEKADYLVEMLDLMGITDYFYKKESYFEQ